MENTLKKCPYDGRRFIPKRSNQIYASSESRVAFHNRKYKVNRRKLDRINNKLFNNYIIIKKLIQNNTEIQLNDNYLIGRGFSFKYITHLMTKDNFTFYGLYDFSFCKVSNEETKFFINGNN